jgi:hypothetical protein
MVHPFQEKTNRLGGFPASSADDFTADVETSLSRPESVPSQGRPWRNSDN